MSQADELKVLQDQIRDGARLFLCENCSQIIYRGSDPAEARIAVEGHKANCQSTEEVEE